MTAEVSFKEARRRAEKFARERLSEFDIDAAIPLLDERYEENSVLWIFFRNRKIKIPNADAKVSAHEAYAVSKLGAVLGVQDHFEDGEALREQMARFEALPSEKRNRIFRDPKESE